MNQPYSKTTRHSVAGICVLLALLLLGWFVLHEPPVPAGNNYPLKVATAPPHVQHGTPRFAPEDTANRETMTNRLAESTISAAVLYRQAFALYNELTKEQKNLISNWQTNVDASVESELCQKLQPICDLLHQAAAVSNCDWGVEQPIMFATLVPHIPLCRSMARAAVWNVAHCRSGDLMGAVDDLAAASRAGHNASLPPILIGHLVDLSIQGMIEDWVAAHASTWADAGGPPLAELFSGIDFDEQLRRTFEQEADMANREADKLTAMPPDEAMGELEKLINTPDENWAAKLSALLESTELPQIIAYMRQAAELQREYAKALELPEAEFRERLDALQAAENANPLVGFFTDGSAPLERTQAMTIRGAMVVAGLAVIRDGKDALASYPDPATGQPFNYMETPDGFELQSNSSYQLGSQAVRLRFK